MNTISKGKVKSMMEGIIMKMYETHAVVLSEKKYYRIKLKNNMKQGQNILFTENDMIQSQGGRKKMKSGYKKITAIAASLLVLVTSSFMMNQKGYASAVVVDINPSVQLNLNDEEIVEGFIALNEDANSLELEQLTGMSLAEALEYVAQSAVDNGFIDPEDLEDDYIIITAVSEKEQKDIESIVKQVKKESDILKTVNIAYTEASMDQVEEAKEKNEPVGLISVGESIDDSETLTVKSFFQDENAKSLFLEKGIILKENLDHEIDRLQNNLETLDLTEEEVKDLNTVLAYTKEEYSYLVDELKIATEQYEEAIESGDENEIELALDTIELLEDLIDSLSDDDNIERLKDLLEDTEMDEEAIEDLFDSLEELIEEIELDDLDDMDEDDMDDMDEDYMDDMDEDDMDDLDEDDMDDMDEDDMDDMDEDDMDDMDEDDMDDMDEDDMDDMDEDDMDDMDEDDMDDMDEDDMDDMDEDDMDDMDEDDMDDMDDLDEDYSDEDDEDYSDEDDEDYSYDEDEDYSDEDDEDYSDEDDEDYSDEDDEDYSYDEDEDYSDEDDEDYSYDEDEDYSDEDYSEDDSDDE